MKEREIIIPLDVFNKLVDESRELAALKDECNYEYGVRFTREEEGIPHRDSMTKETAEEWINEWRHNVAPKGNPDAFTIIRRVQGPWEDVKY